MKPTPRMESEIYCKLEDGVSYVKEPGFISSKYRGCSLLTFQQGPRGEFSTKIGIFAEEGISVNIIYPMLKYSQKIGSRPAQSRVISGRPISERADSEACFSLAQQWLSTCLKEHTHICPHNPAAPLPTRVIDVGRTSGAAEPFLHISTGEPVPYIALSHCWGTNQKSLYTTTQENISDRQRAIPLSDMPKTFQDAITITRRLGYQYLWIDSLCIIQNSREDWATESSFMGEYYKNSILTIAADKAAGDDEGFLETPRQSKLFPPVKIPFNGGLFDQGSFVYIRAVPEYDNHNMPLAKRAWVLQEHVLSPRALHYRTEQLVWECQKYSLFEGDANPEISLKSAEAATKRLFLAPEHADADWERARQVQESNTSRQQFPSHYHDHLLDPFNRWYNIVSNFMSRAITKQSDRFPAISGIAREVHKQTGLTYLAGLWREDIIRGLLWTPFGHGRQPPNYLAPSWSWASVEYGVITTNIYHYNQNGIEPQVKAELVSSHIDMDTTDPYGRVKGGHIILRSRWLPVAKWDGLPPRFYPGEHPDGTEAFALWVLFDQKIGKTRWGDHGSRVGVKLGWWDMRNLYLLHLCSTEKERQHGVTDFALLLKPAANKDEYCRVGIALMVPRSFRMSRDPLDMSKWEMKAVKVV